MQTPEPPGEAGAERRRMEWRRLIVLQHERRIQRRNPDPPPASRTARGRQSVARQLARPPAPDGE